MTSLTNCPVCASDDIVRAFKASDQQHPVKGTYAMWRCVRCKSRFINPRPTDMGKHYPSSYYSYKPQRSAFADLMYATYYNPGNLLRKLLLLPMKFSLRSAHIVPGGRLLDVGSGSGDFLLRMKPYMECVGVEPFDFDRNWAKQHKLTIINSPLRPALFAADHFDCITLNHVIEHVPDPGKDLRILRKFLKKDGKLIVATPVYGKIMSTIWGPSWFGFDVPRHLTIFTQKSFVQLAQKNGYRVSKIRYCSSPDLPYLSLQYVLNRWRSNKYYSHTFRRNIPFLIFFACTLPFTTLLNLLRQGDIAEFVLEKAE